MKKGLTIGIMIAIIALTISAISLYVVNRNTNKIGFILVTNVFNEFAFKNELETKYTLAKNARKKILDSLLVDISVLSHNMQSIESNPVEKQLLDRKKIEYNHKLQTFEEDNAFMSKQFDEQIIKQLNQYVQDYGRENKFDIIYGNTTNGSIMYGTKELDVTKDVIQFINNRYKGVN